MRTLRTITVSEPIEAQRAAWAEGTMRVVQIGSLAEIRGRGKDGIVRSNRGGMENIPDCGLVRDFQVGRR